MSMNLYFRPLPRTGKVLSHALKLALERGGILGLGPHSTHIGREDLPYLRGLRDARVEDADVLIAAIEKYGAVEIYIAE